VPDWFVPRGARASGGWECVIDDSIEGWRHTGLRVADVAGDAPLLPAGEVERMVVPLAGEAFEVRVDGEPTTLAGRASVFDGPADVLYAGAGTEVRIRGAGRVAVAEAPASTRFPSAVLRAPAVPVELRGAGPSTRQVHNFGVPGALEAEKLIVCEVITPAGNWSSHPAHKHDEATPTESRLEEIYYFEAAVERGVSAPRAEPFGLFAAYGSPVGDIDLTTVVRAGDVALVPHGYHGPAAAPPGYDLYYLNVMAGPDPDRAWRIRDDPAQAWVRDTWLRERPDPRLPYAAKEGTG
jgi:5-deoxy-glucuronate isomerase